MNERALAGALAWMLGAAACSGGAGNAPAESRRPSRIVSVNLGADEVLADLVGLDRIVGVSAFADDASVSSVAGRYPPSIARVRGDLERILELRPDLVCVNPYNGPDFLEALRRSALPTFRFDAITSLQGIRSFVVALGARVGEPERARAVVAAMDARLAAVDASLRGVASRPRSCFWNQGWTAGLETSIGDVIERAGGANAAAELSIRGNAAVSLEKAVALDPDVWLMNEQGALDGALAKTRGRVVRVPGRPLGALSPSIVEAVESLARSLHPERFP